MFEVICILAFAFWVGLTLDFRRRWPRRCYLSPDGSVAPGEDLPDIVAIVPARDEADVIGTTVTSLLSQQTRARFRVVLVDDQSTDGTAEVAERAARNLDASDRLEIVRTEPGPPGWVGKVHAMATGVRVACESGAGPDLFWFTDADISHRPGALESLLSRARVGNHDLVSVMARLATQSFWEKLLIPPFIYFFQLLYPFSRVSRAGTRVAAAAGGCVLLKRETLERAGGLETIRDALIDDVALARVVKRVGGSLWLGFDDGIASTRPYEGLSGIWRMVARSAFVQLRYRYELALAVFVGLLVFFVSPPITMFVALVGLGMSDAMETSLLPTSIFSAWEWCLILSALGWFLETLALWPAVRQQRVPPVFALTLPLGALLYGCMTLSSAWSHWRGHGSQWKGRAYSVTDS